MSTHCPVCFEKGHILQTRKQSRTGQIRRRIKCGSCDYIWVRHEDAPGSPGVLGISCDNCQHWKSDYLLCDLGLLDPLTEGVAFAKECTFYCTA